MCSQYKHKKQIQQSFANKNSNPSADMALASPVLIATSGNSENIIPSDRLSKSVIRHIRCRQTACSQTSDTGVRISAEDRVWRPHNPEANSSPVRNVKYAFCPSTDKITVNNIYGCFHLDYLVDLQTVILEIKRDGSRIGYESLSTGFPKLRITE